MNSWIAEIMKRFVKNFFTEIFFERVKIIRFIKDNKDTLVFKSSSKFWPRLGVIRYFLNLRLSYVLIFTLCNKLYKAGIIFLLLVFDIKMTKFWAS